MDIIPETINRIRLSDNELELLYSVVKKIDKKLLNDNEVKFYKILLGRLEGRLNLKKKYDDL